MALPDPRAPYLREIFTHKLQEWWGLNVDVSVQVEELMSCVRQSHGKLWLGKLTEEQKAKRRDKMRLKYRKKREARYRRIRDIRLGYLLPEIE